MKRKIENVKGHAFDYVIIGAGPAGLQLAHYLQRANRNFVVLEAERPGHFFTKYPRHRRLISSNKIYTGFDDGELNLRWDWNSLLTDNERFLFKNYSKDYFPPAKAMVLYLRDFASAYKLNVRCGVCVTRISKLGSLFEVSDQHGNNLRGRVVIVATGVPLPHIPPIPGIDLAELYGEVSINPQDFAGQRVLVIGKGNSAFETANNLISTASLIHLASRNPVRMAWKSHYVGHLRAVNNEFLDTYLLKSQNALVDASIERIQRSNGQFRVAYSYAHADSEIEELVYDRVILCTGFRFDDSIFDDTCRPLAAIDGRFPAQTSAWESVNVPGLYFAGVLMHMRDFKKHQSGFIHGFRYNIKLLSSIFDFRYHGKALVHKSIQATPAKISSEIIQRVNRSSSLWQQTGFMCDLIVSRPDGTGVDYYTDLTVDYVQDHFPQAEQYYTVTLEFGQDRIDAAADVFRIERPHKNDVARAHLSTGIHPIIRRYCQGRLVRVHHVIEDFASEWREEVHVKPLQEFFASEFAMPLGSGGALAALEQEISG
jgi:thioredoxin reductase